jgi:methionyl-tRNA formyltransferase
MAEYGKGIVMTDVPESLNDTAMITVAESQGMNVLIITEEDVFYVYEFFREFYRICRGAPYSIKGITILAPFNKKSPIDLAKQMYGFYGLFNFLRMGTAYVLKKLTGGTIENLSHKNGIPVVPCRNVNDAVYVESVKRAGIDIIVSVAAPQIFRKPLLAAPRYGCINSHSALLPENRGMMPVFWTMFKGSTEVAVTVHYMDESLDAGSIIVQERLPRSDRSLHELILATKRVSAALVHKVLLDIISGRRDSTPMPAGGSCQTFPTPAEVKEFKRRGNKLF